MKDSLIVVSGGMDSITLLYECADRIALAVSFDYGANHNHKEIPFARIHCERLKIKHIVIPLAFMKEYFRSSLLDGSDSVPEGHYADENMKSTVVPFRNGIMLSVACGMAEITLFIPIVDRSLSKLWIKLCVRELMRILASLLPIPIFQKQKLPIGGKS